MHSPHAQRYSDKTAKPGKIESHMEYLKDALAVAEDDPEAEITFRSSRPQVEAQGQRQRRHSQDTAVHRQLSVL